MRTNLTETISIDADPETVLSFVADPHNLPLWAPAAAQLRLVFRVSRDIGTVDFLAADAPRDRPIGAYSRVLPNGRGSEYSFTRFLSPELSAADVARERAALAQELETVRACCEGKEPARVRIYTSSGPAPNTNQETNACSSPPPPPH
jgi:hypothetical protein